MVNKITVQRRADGQYEGRRDGASRASTVAPTQREAVKQSSDILRRSGGGEVAIRGLDGQIREQNTIHPGNDPRKSEG